ncbi:unnamed protein product [marine sediment metagenome]|uniref:HEAT repeat domain-containing protein n=1 Tax=marine sediment metagenome TaxID=412755 RepID=X0S1M2_9ZZZZ
MGILKKLTKLFGPSEIKILKEKGDVEGLIQLMERFPHDYCGAIFKALGELGDERAVEPILKTLEKKPKTFLTVEAINAFRKIGSDRAVAALSKLLENPKTNHDEHIKIINALGEIRSESAIEQLINMLGDYLMYHVSWSGLFDRTEGDYAAHKLQEIGQPAIGLLTKAISEHENESLRQKAGEVLTAIENKE